MFKKINLDKKFYTRLFIVFLVFVASLLRFYNLNWDNGSLFHPDERNIDNAVTKIKFFSQLDPQFFAYGGFTIYLYRITADVVSFITKNGSWTMDWGDINIIGRFFSALFSTLTIIPLYFLVKKVSDEKSSLVAIILYVFTVASIQTAHYGVTESLITFFGVIICLFSIKNFRNMNIFITFFLGLISGIAIAAKTSSLSFVLMPFASYLLSLRKDGLIIKRVLINFFCFSAICFITFTFFSPFTFLNWNKFTESMKYESGVATGSLPVVYTLQFDNTIPYIFQIQNLFWQLGPMALICVAGFMYVLYRALRTKNKELIIFILFPLMYFLYVGSWHTKFIRYMVPIIPFLIISGSIFLTHIRSKFRKAGNVLIILVVLLTMFWGLAFFSIYTRTQTRLVASSWIYKNIPLGNKILNEQWDDGLPIGVGNNNQGQYQITSLAMYDADNGAKIDYLSNNLSNADYIILNSRRLYGTLIHLTNKYPITSRYYKLLFAGKLGFIKTAEFSSYPSLFGISINDDKSEETFQVYDHPKVIVFKNEKRFSEEEIQKIIKNEKAL